MKDLFPLESLLKLEKDHGQDIQKEALWKEHLSKTNLKPKEEFFKDFISSLENFIPNTFLEELKKNLSLQTFSHQEIVFLLKKEDLARKIQQEFKDLFREKIFTLLSSKPTIRFKIQEDFLKLKGIDPQKTFENFIIGPSNSMAQAFALCVAQNPGKLYPALYIYGHSGLGKTHLLYAIGNYIHSQHSDLKILFTSANVFMHDMIQCIKEGQLFNFRKKYVQDIDVLFIDDIQELQDKKATQNEFFHVFNELQFHKKQLIFTSDKHPKDITGLEDRIQSRLNSMLVTEIHFPDLETRVAILEKKAKEKNIELSTDVAIKIAQKITTNIRELEGQLIQLGAYHQVLEKPDPLIKEKKNLDQSLLEISASFEIKKEDLLGKARQKHISRIRQLILYALYEEDHYTLEQLGNIFSNRDHTSILYAIKNIKNELNKNPLLYEELVKIKYFLKQ